jgi:hypothetical protein
MLPEERVRSGLAAAIVSRGLAEFEVAIGLLELRLAEVGEPNSL